MLVNKKIEFDSNTQLQSYAWYKEGADYKAVILLAHGMSEYLVRYNDFAEFMVERGYVVIGSDHYAHGYSAKDAESVGVVTEYDFLTAILQSIKLTRDAYPEFTKDKPVYLFAHSMGSMAAQRYIQLYPKDFSKVVICGTDCPSIKYKLASKIASMAIKKHGEISYLNFIESLGCGAFSKKFKKEGKYAWLTRDKEVYEKYSNDPLCGKQFPTNYYKSLGDMLCEAGKKKNIKEIDKDLKILIVAGKSDPVGGMGKGPSALHEKYLKAGLNSCCKLYKDARHEILNEISPTKEEVLLDLIKFYRD